MLDPLRANLSGAYTPRFRHNHHSPELVRQWLVDLCALPTQTQYPGQLLDALNLTSQLLALRRELESQARPMLAWRTGKSAKVLARAVARQFGWPSVFNELPHWLLATGLANGHLSLPRQDGSGPWPIDLPSMAQATSWAKLWDRVGGVAKCYVLARHLQGRPQGDSTPWPLDATRWRLDAGEDALWSRWVLSWVESGSLDEASERVAVWWGRMRPVVKSMWSWRRRWLPDEDPEQAWRLSATAAVMAQADHFVQQVWEQAGAGLPTQAQTLPVTLAGEPEAATQTSLWLAWLTTTGSARTDELLVAKRYWAGQLLPMTAEPLVS